MTYAYVEGERLLSHRLGLFTYTILQLHAGKIPEEPFCKIWPVTEGYC